MNRVTTPLSVPAIPFPAQPDVPRWCVRRFPTVGSDSVELVAFDGDGYPLHRHVSHIGANVERVERFLRSLLDEWQAADPDRASRPSPTTLHGPRLVP